MRLAALRHVLAQPGGPGPPPAAAAVRPSLVGRHRAAAGRLAATGTAQTLLWLAALVGDYVGTILAGANGWRLRSAGHFAERHGLIIIIALGESIVAIGVGIAELPISWPIIAASLLGLAVSGALWWAYFDVTALVTEHALAAPAACTDPARPRRATASCTCR